MKRCEATLAYACEDNELSINCGDEVIHIINANYGRLGSELCPENIANQNVECIYSQTADVVRYQ